LFFIKKMIKKLAAVLFFIFLFLIDVAPVYAYSCGGTQSCGTYYYCNEYQDKAGDWQCDMSYEPACEDCGYTYTGCGTCVKPGECYGTLSCGKGNRCLTNSCTQPGNCQMAQYGCCVVRNGDWSSCNGPYCGQKRTCNNPSPACEGADCDAADEYCSNVDNGIPTTPTCTSLGEVVGGDPVTISWTSGGVLTDSYEYILDGGAAVNVGNVLSADVSFGGGLHTWQVRAVNTTCDSDISAWSSSCTYCLDCVGTIKGTFFDATDLSSCPADIGTDPLYAELRYGSRTFGMNGTWGEFRSPLPISTDADGNYLENFYTTPPQTFTYDYSDMIDSGLVRGVRLECQSPVATYTNWGDIVTKDTGFWGVSGGWWQAVGSSVYARNGIRSVIPVTVLPEESQVLILPDVNGRLGLLSYGVPWTGRELGYNPSAKASTSWWRIESLFEGQHYDYDYYKTRMDIFDSTDWDGGNVEYTGGGAGYQIFKHTGDVTLSYGGPAEKVILLIDGNVTINNNVITPTGAFLAVVASGNITFGSSVTDAQGWFVAENINVPCDEEMVFDPIEGVWLVQCSKTDVQFKGEGSFVGWLGISLRRDMWTANDLNPSEKFTYRADFLLNAPTPMKVYTKRFNPFIP
jgi:hypothetical protein